jgi:hypothetical protein
MNSNNNRSVAIAVGVLAITALPLCFYYRQKFGAKVKSLTADASTSNEPEQQAGIAPSYLDQLLRKLRLR